jgi:DNA-binding response OmpR family regulator
MGNVRILVVDDSRPQVTLLQGVLKNAGYEVYAAYDGKSGLEQARQLKPHLIILDIMMPEMDGYEVCWRLKNDPDTVKIAVLMLTARGGIEEDVSKNHQFAMRVKDRMRGYGGGAVDFMTKPVTGKDLAKRVKALLWSGGIAS